MLTMTIRYLQILKESPVVFSVLILTVLFSCQCSKKDSLDKPIVNPPLDGRGGGIIAYSVTYTNGTNKLFVMNADGSVNNQLTNQSGRPLGPAWSPDASKIAYYNHMSDQKWSLFIMNSDGTNSCQLTNEPNTLDWCASWSPNGNQILFTRSFISPNWRSKIMVMNSDGTNIQRIGNI